MGSSHSPLRMDPKNLISRIELAAVFHVHPQTIAAWTRRGLFPEPKECLSDGVILYDRDEVRRALDQRKAARLQRVASRLSRRGQDPFALTNTRLLATEVFRAFALLTHFAADAA